MPGQSLRWPDVNTQVRAWLEGTANVRRHRTTRSRPIDLWQEEKPLLIPLPANPFDAAITRALRASHQALVRFEGNFYSVPHTYAYKTLILKATPTEVRLLADTTKAARHTRSFERGVVIEDPRHYDGVLSTKRKHFGLILTKRFRELGPQAPPFMEGLLRTESRAAHSDTPHRRPSIPSLASHASLKTHSRTLLQKIF